MRWFAMASAAAALASQGGLFSTRTGLALAGFLMLLGLTQQLPGFRKTAAGILFVIAGATFFLPATRAWFAIDWPASSAALRNRQQYSDQVAAELADVEAQRAKIGLLAFCRRIDRLQSDWLQVRLAELERPLRPPEPPSFFRRLLGRAETRPAVFPLPDTNAVQRLADRIPVIAKYREECRKAALPAESETKLSERLKSWPERIADGFTSNPRLVLWTVVALLLAALAVAAVTGQAKVWPAAKTGAMLIFAALVANWLIWGGEGTGNLPGLSGWTIGKQTRVIQIHPTKWSQPLRVDPCTGWLPYPEPGETVEVTTADSGMKAIHRYTPTESPTVSGRGPFYFRGTGKAVRVEIYEPRTYCWRAKSAGRGR